MADEEFLNTLRNIGTKWYQCPNGHAYVIGECGLAMIESRCPECGEKIGGRDHTLLKTNKLVDFDLDVKNNINITPVKVINKKDNINVDKKEKEEKNEKEENKEKKENKDNDKNEKEQNKENKKNKDNDKNEKEENKEDQEDKINNLTEKEE